MNKAIVLGGIGLAGIYLVYHAKQKANPSLGIPAPANSLGAKPRVDNKSQPWYVGPVQGLVSSKVAAYQKNPTSALQDGQSVVHSLSDVWGSVSGFFGGSGDTGSNTVQSPDAVPDLANTAGDMSADNNLDSLPASGADQSNIIGDSYGNQDNMEFNMMASNDANTYDTIDWSNSDIGGDMSSDYESA